MNTSNKIIFIRDENGTQTKIKYKNTSLADIQATEIIRRYYIEEEGYTTNCFGRLKEPKQPPKEKKTLSPQRSFVKLSNNPETWRWETDYEYNMRLSKERSH